MESAPTLSFPAILRNPGLSDRFAHLHLQEQSSEQVVAKPRRTAIKRDNEGKRWVRRKDNARFTDNPHIVVATRADYNLPLPDLKATFPEPLPAYLHRNTKVPDTIAPERDPNSANAGRFSLSLKGMRRSLRKSGFRAEALVRDIEAELLHWLQAGGTIINPDQDLDLTDDPVMSGTPIRNTETIFEVSRTPLQLVWYTNDDNFARYVIHCCARYHEVVSFSKELSGRRLTYLLRPNAIRPDHHAVNSLDTPPPTDIDHTSHFDTESDRAFETDSDAESVHPREGVTNITGLSSIAEDSDSPHDAQRQSDEETWSLVGDDEVDPDSPSENVSSLTSGMNAIKASPRTPRHRAIARRRFSNRERGVSSPSRSPAPKPFRRPAPCAKKAIRPDTFYQFLYT